MHFLLTPHTRSLWFRSWIRSSSFFDVGLSSKWPLNPALHFSPQWIRICFSLFLYFILHLQHPLSHSDLQVEMECVFLCVFVYVYYNPSFTVKKWFNRPCHMVGKWWIEAPWHTIKPVNLSGSVGSHMSPHVWPANTHTQTWRHRRTHANWNALNLRHLKLSEPARLLTQDLEA